MTKHPLSGMFRNQPYTPQLAESAPIYEDLYAFDITLGCRYIACRTQSTKRSMGKSIYDIMTPVGAEELLSHMTGKSHAPMFVKTVHGTALVICSLVPSCSVGLLIYTQANADILYRICRRCGVASLYSRELVKSRRCRITEHFLQNEECCLSLMSRYMRVLSTKLCNRMLTGNLTQLLEQQIYELSYFVGCPVSLDCKNNLLAYSDFDIGMFTALILLVLMNARMFSTDGRVSICLHTKNRVPFIKFSMKLRDGELEHLPSFEALCFTAHRKSMPYDFCREDGMLSGELSPLPDYLSRLTNKSPSEASLTEESEACLHTAPPRLNANTLLTVEEMLILSELLRSGADTSEFWSAHRADTSAT